MSLLCKPLPRSLEAEEACLLPHLLALCLHLQQPPIFQKHISKYRLQTRIMQQRILQSGCVCRQQLCLKKLQTFMQSNQTHSTGQQHMEIV